MYGVGRDLSHFIRVIALWRVEEKEMGWTGHLQLVYCRQCPRYDGDRVARLVFDSE